MKSEKCLLNFFIVRRIKNASLLSKGIMQQYQDKQQIILLLAKGISD